MVILKNQINCGAIINIKCFSNFVLFLGKCKTLFELHREAMFGDSPLMHAFDSLLVQTILWGASSK